MKSLTLLKILLIQLLLVAILQAASTPTILYTSTSIYSKVAPVGSLAGGTIVYIFGTNFSPDPSLILVFFGQYPCNLKAESSSVSMIACVTSPATSSTSLNSLPLTIYIQGQTPLYCNSNNCVFSYSNWQTPVVQELIPKSVKNGDILSIFGIHRITDPGDGRSTTIGQIQSLLINGYTCSIIDVIQQDTIDPNSRDYIACKVASGDIAGEYNFTETVSPGTANSSVRSYQTSFLTNTSYQLRLIAQITSDFAHTGGYNGQKLALTITGESPNPQQYACSIAGQQCVVSSVDSSINVVYVQIPKYNSSNTLFGRISQETNDTSVQMTPFLGSNGFKYSRYALQTYKTLSDWVNYFRAGNISITVLQPQTIRTQLGSPEIYGSNSYVQYLNGYLYIPYAGTYSFYGIVDDSLIVNLAQYQNNSNSANMQTIIQIDSYIADNYNPYIAGTSPKYTRTFTDAGYYYMEVVSLNYGGTGYFKVIMEAPNITENVPSNPAWQIDYISIKQADLKPEIINVTVKNTGIGSSSYRLYYYVTVNGQLALQSSDAIQANTSAQIFRKALGTLYTLGDYSPSVTLRTFDSSKILTQDVTIAVYYQYSINITRWRDTSIAKSVLPFTDTGLLGNSIWISTTQSHSAPIQGTYKLFINNNPVSLNNGTSFSITSIPFDTNEGSLSSAINNIYKSNQISVRQIMNTYTKDSIQFVIQYYGVRTLYEIKFDVSALTGGSNNLFNTNYTVIRSFSNNFIYDPIPYEFLRTAQTRPQLYMTINQIPVVCKNCAYAFNQSLSVEVTSATLNGQEISFALSNPNSVVFTLSDIQVSFLGVPCNIASGTISSFVCSFAKDAKGNSLIPSGTGVPVVHVKSIGYAITTSVSNITVSISLTSFYPNLAGPQGLVSGIITGSGFPVVNSNNAIAISLCGNLVNNFTSISNNEISFLVPPQGSTCNTSSSYISINSNTFPLNFTYEATISPLVSALSLSSASPILKQTIQITGSNFGVTSNIQVFLYDTFGTVQYELTIINSTQTSIYCILGGGKTGDYYVRVLNKAVTGSALSFASPASFFQYAIFVQNVSPISGPMGGGYDITITGRNFASADSTNVFVGDAINNLCKIKTITSTIIVCTTPSMDSSYTPGLSVNITVTGRVVEESRCNGVCTFTFDASVSNNVTTLATTTYNAGDIITVTGFNLTGAQVYLQNLAVPSISSTADNITFAYPALTTGSYNIKILTSNGFAYPPILTTTALSLPNGISRSSGSYAGHIITVAGNGMTTKINDGNTFTMKCPIGGSFILKRINASANLHAFEIPMNPGTTDQYCTINITQGTVFRAYGYSYSSYLTNVSTATLTSAGNNNFYLLKTNSSSTSFQKAWVQVLDTNGNPTTSTYPLTISSVNASTYLLTSTNNYLPAGYLRIRAHSFICGYSQLTGENITILMLTLNQLFWFTSFLKE